MGKTGRLQGDSKLWRNLFMLASLALFTAVFIYGPTILLDKQGNDAETIMDLATTGKFDKTEGGYYYMAQVAMILPSSIQKIIVFILGSLFIYRLFRDLRTPIYTSTALLLSVAPVFMFLTIFVKDTTMPLLTIFILHILQGQRSIHTRIGIILLIYAGYGVFFRQYYLLIAMIFFGIYFLSRTRPRWLLFYAPIIIAALLLIPSNIFPELQGSRDLFNARNSSIRSAFFNYVPPTDLASFIVNYVYAAARLNLSPLFYLSIKEVFLFINNITFMILMFFGMRNTDDKIRYPAFLFLSHILVLIIFEPDLGSYLRHSSSALLYLVPALVALDRRFLMKLVPMRRFKRPHASISNRRRPPSPARTLQAVGPDSNMRRSS